MTLNSYFKLKVVTLLALNYRRVCLLLVVRGGTGLTLPVCIATRARDSTAAVQLVCRNLQRQRAVIPAIAWLSCFVLLSASATDRSS